MGAYLCLTESKGLVSRFVSVLDRFLLQIASNFDPYLDRFVDILIAALKTELCDITISEPAETSEEST